jgi:FKBP-type peptidyl-prolyl cis-trans isomerase
MKTNFFKFFSLFTAVLAVSGCMETENEFNQQIEFEEGLLNDYFAQNNLEPTRDNSGIYYEVLESNPDGEPVEEEDIVGIRYVMRRLSGQMIDSLASNIQEADTVVRFQHVNGALYPDGINLGVRLMNEGEKFRLYLPSYRAFNEYSYKTLIPSETIIIADVEVVEVISMDDMKVEEKQRIGEYVATHQLENVEEKSTGIFYQRLSSGSGNQVEVGKQVKIAYKGYYLNDEVFDESETDQPIKFTVGYSDIISGFEAGIKLMKEGEKGRIFIPSHLAYGASVQVVPGFVRKSFLKHYNLRDMQPFQTLIFEVEVKDID